MQLYELVQSMTKPERRYFKSYTKSGTVKQSRYLSLFDILSKTESYDEKKITKKGYTYHDRSLLMEKILEALHVLHSRKSVDAEIQMLLNQATILYSKNILNEMNKRLEKAKKLALENERLELLLCTIRMQIELSPASLHVGTLDEELLKTKEKLSQQIDYEYIKFQMSRATLKDRFLSKPETRERIRQLTASPCLTDLSASSSVITKLYYHTIKSDCSFTFEDKENYIFHIREIVRLISENRFILTILPKTSITFYFFYILYLERANQPFQKDMDILDVIENTPTNSYYELYLTYGRGVEYCTLKLDKIRGELLISKIDVAKDILINKMSRLWLWACCQIMIFYGTFGEWGQAQIRLNIILSDKRSGYLDYAKFRARFYSLIIYYELDINDFKTHLQSVRKYLQRYDGYNQLARKIIQNLSHISEITQEKKKRVLWKKLYHALQDEANPTDEFHIPINELKQWCKSKIESITIVEVIRKEREQQLGEVLE